MHPELNAALHAPAHCHNTEHEVYLWGFVYPDPSSRANRFVTFGKSARDLPLGTAGPLPGPVNLTYGECPKAEHILMIQLL